MWGRARRTLGGEHWKNWGEVIRSILLGML